MFAPTFPNPQDQSRVTAIQRNIFAYLKLDYTVNEVPIGNEDRIHTIFVPCADVGRKEVDNFYVGHGFSGSSLMKFPVLRPLVNRGNVILWEIRGMGVGHKPVQYQHQTVDQIQKYFLQGVSAVIQYYQHTNATFVCHSFSSYLLLLYMIRHPDHSKKHIKQMLLMSPVGLTTKQQDYKDHIGGCSDLMYTIGNAVGWCFNITFKSPFRMLCSNCCRDYFVYRELQQFDLTQKQVQLMHQIVDILLQLPDGSQCIFFKYFDPRVIPKIPLQPMLKTEPVVKITIVYGGETDWVDKLGARKISMRFPNKITFMTLPVCGHNIPFHIRECKQLFAGVFQN